MGRGHQFLSRTRSTFRKTILNSGSASVKQTQFSQVHNNLTINPSSNTALHKPELARIDIERMNCACVMGNSTSGKDPVKFSEGPGGLVSYNMTCFNLQRLQRFLVTWVQSFIKLLVTGVSLDLHIHALVTHKRASQK